jgi:regulator of ribonuclease activity A
MKIINTTDLCDSYPETIRVAVPIGFRDFGGTKNFHGKIQTVKCFEDNTLVRKALEENGDGKVLVVDGGGSLRCALLGGMMGELAVKNHWNGIIVYGCIRDAVALSQLALGLKGLNINPLKSAKRNEGQENVTVHFADVDFVPDEFVYCDEDGIVVSKEDYSK